MSSPPGVVEPSGETAVLLLDRDPAAGGRLADRLAAEDRFAVTTGESPDVGSGTDGYDCVLVVVDGAGGADGIESISTLADRRPDLPVIACGEDPAVAEDAFAAGADDFFEIRDRGGAVSLLARRVENAVGSVRAREDLRSNRDALAEFHDITADRSLSFDEKVRRLLSVGRERLGVSSAILAEVDGDGEWHATGGEDGDLWRVVASDQDRPLVEVGTETDLSNTYCRNVTDTDELYAVHDADAQGLGEDPAREYFDLACYLGGRVVVDDELYGMLCFLDRDGRPPFSEDERRLVEVIVQWVGQELERREYERELDVRTRAMENASIGLTLADPSGDVPLTWVNEGFEETTGYEESDVRGRNCRFLQGPDTDPEAVATLREGIENEESVAVTLRNYRADGTPFWNHVEVDPIYDDDGQLVRFLGSQTDVTDRVERERALQQLHEATRSLLRADDRDAVARQAVAAAEDVLGFEFSGIHFYDPAADVLRPGAATETTVEQVGELVEQDPREGLFGAAFSAGETKVYDDLDAATDADYSPVTAATVLPLGSHGTLGIGTVQSAGFDDADVSLAKVLAANVTTAIERVDRESALRSHRDRLRQVVDATRELMTVEDRTGATDAVTDAATNVLGFDAAVVRRHDPEAGTLEPVAVGGELDRLGTRPVVDVDDSPHGRAFRTGETATDRPDGEDDPYDREGYAQSMYVPLGDYGLLVLGIERGSFDAFDRQLAELLAASTAAALERLDRRETLERQAEVLETVQGMVYALDETGRFSLVTDPFARRLGYRPDELVGEPAGAVFDEDAVAEGDRIVADLLAGDHESAVHETGLVTATGDRVPVEVEVSLLPPDEDGDFAGTVGAVRDRTELETTRDELSRERDRFTHLFEYLPDPINEVEYVDGRPVIREVNPAFEEAFGYDRSELLDRPANDYLRAPDGEREAAEIDDRARDGEVVTEEVRRATADGPRDFLFRGIPYRTGDRTRALGVYTDITEQKRRQHD